MLIDVTRRPVRLHPEECPTVVVIRTMGIQGKVNGLLHQEHPQNRKVSYTASPKAKVAQGTHEYMETILPGKRTFERLAEARERAAQALRERDYTRIGRARPFIDVSYSYLDDEEPQQPFPNEPYHVATGFQNQQGAGGGVWRLSFILDPAPKEGLRLLTLLDETHSVMLFTLTVPDDVGREDMFKTITPLQRMTKNQFRGSGGGLWAALDDADDEA
jgi:hypothetical protein